jgi:hypothetical protein
MSISGLCDSNQRVEEHMSLTWSSCEMHGAELSTRKAGDSNSYRGTTCVGMDFAFDEYNRVCENT